MVYLFIGEDSASKDIKLKAIREEHLDKGIEQFNLDLLYAKGLSLKDLQERLIYLPVKSPQRIVVIKGAQDLKEDAADFILEYVKKPQKKLILILDINQQGKTSVFIKHIYKYATVYHFKETKQLDTFTLSRSITAKNPDYALRILNQLLKNGERPERILGGLRYVWERDAVSGQEMRRGLRLLLNCDIEIKTGRLKPTFALEKLVINLCGLREPFH